MTNRKARAINLKVQGNTYKKIGLLLGITTQAAQQLCAPSYFVRNALRERSGDKCEDCKTKPGPLHAHHLKHETNEQWNSLVNLAYLCVSCHQKRHGGDPRRKGYVRRKAA